MTTIDILMITYNRPDYTRLALSRLLATCDRNMRVWLWHNGNDEETLAIVRDALSHPNVYKFHHSIENKKLREPTNWLFDNAEGDFLSKVDDDCLMPDGWADTLRQAHADEEQFGVLGCWRFQEEDFVPNLARKKIQEFQKGHRLLVNCWIEGSGYLMRRACVEQAGRIRELENFTRYCIRLTELGWKNGWYYPFLHQEHMDDPRSPNTMLKTDEDLARRMPLTCKNFGATTIRQWTEIMKADAKYVQGASVDPAQYSGWRPKVRRLLGRVRRTLIRTEKERARICY
ncbi:MAG: glycosyltransferase family 2 protein [Oleiphilaceae bacterium]|nr:glycosyltransferase family 2 protein [Oleiphilaceae bacterium]